MLRNIVTPEVFIFAMNIAAVSLILGLVGLLLTVVVRRYLALQHGLLCVVLGLTVASPILLWLLRDSSHGVFRVPFILPVSPAAVQELGVTVPGPSTNTQGISSAIDGQAEHKESRLEMRLDERVDVARTSPRVIDSSASAFDLTRSEISPFRSIPFCIVCCWCLVSAVLTTRLAVGLFRVNRALRDSHETSNLRLIVAAKRVEKIIGLSCRLRVCESRLVTAPASMGFWHPMVVLPEGLSRTLSAGQLLAIILHEAAHVIRRDTCIAVVQKLSLAMFWWNPAIHLVNRNISRLRELICDDLAASWSGHGKSLREAIVRTAEWSTLPRLPHTFTPPLLDQKDELEHRIARLSNERRQVASAMGRREYARILVFAMCLMVGMCMPIFRGVRGSALAAVPSPAAANDLPIADASGSMTRVKAEIPGLEDAVDKSVLFLKGHQHPDGSWTEFDGQPGGLTAICTLAMIKSGVAAGDPSVQRALQYLRGKESPPMVYATALRTIIFCAAEPLRDRQRIERQVKWLQEAQITRSSVQTRSGAWTYGSRMGRGDNSNTRFAAMALSEAEGIGVSVDQQVWERLRTYLLDSQNHDGSWGYHPLLEGTGSTTCGALASLAMSARNCDEPEVQGKCAQAIEAGTKWLEENFTVQTNPKSQSWHFYYLDALARAGTATKQATIGTHDWYREGAELLIGRQHKATGSWQEKESKEGIEVSPLISTSFALLFLSNPPRR